MRVVPWWEPWGNRKHNSPRMGGKGRAWSSAAHIRLSNCIQLWWHCLTCRHYFIQFDEFDLCLIFCILCVLSGRMDPALLRERELFKKRALSTPAVEKRPASSDSGSHKKKKPKVDKESSSGSKLSAGKWRRLFEWLIACSTVCVNGFFLLISWHMTLLVPLRQYSVCQLGCTQYGNDWRTTWKVGLYIQKDLLFLKNLSQPLCGQ